MVSISLPGVENRPYDGGYGSRSAPRKIFSCRPPSAYGFGRNYDIDLIVLRSVGSLNCP
jgi:hypothetical protein